MNFSNFRLIRTKAAIGHGLHKLYAGEAGRSSGVHRSRPVRDMKNPPSFARWGVQRTVAWALVLIQNLGIEHGAIQVQGVVHVFDDHQQALEDKNHQQLNKQAGDARRGHHDQHEIQVGQQT